MSDYTAGKAWKMTKEQRIMEIAFQLFSEKGIEPVTMLEVAEKSGVGRATLYRYFATKTDLVIAVGAWEWKKYIKENNEIYSGVRDRLTGAERLRLYFDTYLDLYRNHRDVLCFNYNINSYLNYDTGTKDQKQPYITVVEQLRQRFHEVYMLGMKDGTLKPEVPESEMFNSSFHLMLAVASRYAIGLIYNPGKEMASEKELIMLEELLLSRFTSGSLENLKSCVNT